MLFFTNDSKRENFQRKLLILTILIVGLFSTKCYGSVEILNVRHWTAPDHTRIVLDVDSDPIMNVRKAENLLVLNFKESSLPNQYHKIILNKPGITKIIFHHNDKNKVKIEFVLNKHQKVEVFKLKKFQDKPNRIVVDIIFADKVLRKEKPNGSDHRTQTEKNNSY